jgi:hypothetical protein
MSVLRQENWLGQQRVDIPHLRSIEAAVAGDFDLLAGTIMAGRAPVIASGFYIVTTGVTQANSLQIQVADSTLIHFFASESGSIFHVPADRANEVLTSTNTRVVGSFTPSQVNYIGIDLVRTTDDSTVDLVQFIDTTSLLEDPKSVPLARTLDYRIVISTTDFDSNPGVAPLAKVTLDSSSGITAIEDARHMFFRLGSGGSTPNPLNFYSWPTGRKEGGTGDTFLGADKNIGSLKQWMDAAMSRVWEVGGGEHWYSPVADRNVVLARTGVPFASTGEFFEWDGTNLHWKGLVAVFANSTASFNEVVGATLDTPGLTDLADGDCIYVDLDRSRNRYVTPPLGQAGPVFCAKAPLTNLGTPEVPGSRWVMAWRFGANIYVRDQSYPVGSAFKIATTATAGDVMLSATDGGLIAPAVVATVDSMSFMAYAAGLTRGSDFVGGAGDITIGGQGSFDHGVVLKTTRVQDEVRVQGSQIYPGNFTAPLSVFNDSDYLAHPRNLTARLIGYDAGAGAGRVAHEFEAAGAIGFRNVPATPQTPSPLTSVPIRSKFFFRDNGIASPNKRDQFCIMWFDGSVSVVFESPTY